MMKITACAARRLAAGLSVAGALGIANTASAAPIQFGSSYYSYVFMLPGQMDWNAANAAASALSFLGSSGHLATLTSAAESNFVANLVLTALGVKIPPGEGGVWIGGQVDATGRGFWVVGPEAGQQFSLKNAALPGAYANWGAGFHGAEPVTLPGDMYISVGMLGVPQGQWGDDFNLTKDARGNAGFVVEFDMTQTPISATLPLFASGLGVLGLLGWRRKKTAPTAV